MTPRSPRQNKRPPLPPRLGGRGRQGFSKLKVMRKGYAWMLLVLLLAIGRVAFADLPKNEWRPKYTVIEPVCQATNWNQDGALNTHVKLDKDYKCGCDPLAWGQILTYHALNHNFPAPDWEPKPVKATVGLKSGTSNTYEERTTMSGKYDWEKIRDQVEEKDANGEVFSHAGRLMWDLGVLGRTQYGLTSGSAGTVKLEDIRDYFHYENMGYLYTAPVVDKILLPYWREMLRTFLRTSLQAGAPLATMIDGHMIVTDGFGFDNDGKEWFHVDYGWGNSSGKWWDMETAVKTIVAIYPNVYPTELGSIIAGRVTNVFNEPISGATVTLTQKDGTFTQTATTDATGTFCFTNLPLNSADALKAEDLESTAYLLTCSADGYFGQTKEVYTHPFIDDALRNTKHNDCENQLGKDELGDNFFFPHSAGNTLQDFTLTEAPGGKTGFSIRLY